MWKMPSKVGHMGATTIKRTTFDLSESGWKQSAKFEFSGKKYIVTFLKYRSTLLSNLSWQQKCKRVDIYRIWCKWVCTWWYWTSNSQKDCFKYDKWHWGDDIVQNKIIKL